MELKFKMKKQNKKSKKKEKKIKFWNQKNSFILAVVLVILIVLIYFGKLIINANVIRIQEEQEKYYDKLVDNCECVERERIYCMEGFELNEAEDLCLKKGGYTGVRKGCSQYDCYGDKVFWNFEDKLWEPVLEFENE